jgi:hypothetical protein
MDICPICQGNLVLIGKVHRCIPKVTVTKDIGHVTKPSGHVTEEPDRYREGYDAGYRAGLLAGTAGKSGPKRDRAAYMRQWRKTKSGQAPSH